MEKQWTHLLTDLSAFHQLPWENQHVLTCFNIHCPGSCRLINIKEFSTMTRMIISYSSGYEASSLSAWVSQYRFKYLIFIVRTFCILYFQYPHFFKRLAKCVLIKYVPQTSVYSWSVIEIMRLLRHALSTILINKYWERNALPQESAYIICGLVHMKNPAISLAIQWKLSGIDSPDSLYGFWLY